jgi:hypothetical protein
MTKFDRIVITTLAVLLFVLPPASIILTSH